MSGEHADRRGGKILRAGVFLSSTLALIGLVLAIVRGHAPIAVHTFHGDVGGIAGVLRAAVAEPSSGIVLVGVLVLVATPLVRLGVAGASFLRARDWTYFAISVVVLGLVATGWVLGVAH